MAKRKLGLFASDSERGPNDEGANKPPARKYTGAVSAGKAGASRDWDPPHDDVGECSSTGYWFLRLSDRAEIPPEEEIGMAPRRYEPKIECRGLPPEGTFLIHCPYCRKGYMTVYRAEGQSLWCCDDCGRWAHAPQKPMRLIAA